MRRFRHLPVGNLTTSMAFDVFSMGVGNDGTSGYPLVGVYLAGKELKAAAEVDASVALVFTLVVLLVRTVVSRRNGRRYGGTRRGNYWGNNLYFCAFCTRFRNALKVGRNLNCIRKMKLWSKRP